jgi:DnaJ family protein C protein 9
MTDSIALGDGEDEDAEFAWSDFYRAQFAEVVTEEAVGKFKAEFQGSEEEKLAVIAAYVTGEGDLDFLFEEVMLSDPLADEERFRAIIDHEIAEQRVEAYAAYVGETKAAKKKRRAKAEREARLAEEAARELGVEDELFGKKGRKSGGGDKNGDHSGLAALIQTRQKERAADFLADLEAKYAPATKKGKKRAVEEPPEEAFARTDKRRKRSKVVDDDDDDAAPAPSPRKTKRARV